MVGVVQVSFKAKSGEGTFVGLILSILGAIFPSGEFERFLALLLPYRVSSSSASQPYISDFEFFI